MITQAQLDMARHYIRDNLHAIRKQTGLSPYQFGNRIGIAADTVKRIEAGQLPIMVTTYKLIDSLKLQMDNLF